LEDRIALRELVESYNDAVMRFDAEDWGSHWAEDGVWSPGRAEVSGREAIVTLWTQIMGGIEVEGFFASAGPLTIDGDRATGRWYQQEFLRSNGIRRAIVGEYDDSYVKVDGQWRFQRRVYKVRSAIESEVPPSA
jgi:hypothetical protein